MQAIRILRGCGASGKSLAAGTVLAVPGEVSERDAEVLVRLGKAEAAAMPPAKPADEDKPKRRKAGE